MELSSIVVVMVGLMAPLFSDHLLVHGYISLSIYLLSNVNKPDMRSRKVVTAQWLPNGRIAQLEYAQLAIQPI